MKRPLEKKQNKLLHDAPSLKAAELGTRKDSFKR